MKNINWRGRSKQPPLQPLLHSARKTEEDEDELTMRAAEATFEIFGGSHAASDQHDAHRNSTTQSTKSEELPEKETGKEVAVRPVNPSLGNEDRKERVTSIANSLEVNGDVGTGKQPGEGAQDMTGLAMPSAIAIAKLPGESYLHPLPGGKSESDSELPSCRHPSSAPEGSLLHALHLQLLGAGSDGITVRELFKCLKKPAEVLGFGCDWKVQVRRHLKTNPYFCEAKGYHYLVCNHQHAVQQPSNKRSPANIASTSRGHGASSSKTVPLDNKQSTPPTVQTGLSVATHEGVVQTRRKAFQKANAALSEQATEFEEMKQSMGDMQIMASSGADPTDFQLVLHVPPSTSSKKRKSPSSHDEELPDHGHPIPGDFPATEAEILTKVEVQTFQRCATLLEDDTGNWRCANMGMAGHTHCEQHSTSHRLEDGETSLPPNPGSPKYLTAPRPSIAPKAAVQPRVKCGFRYNRKDGPRSLQCSTIAIKGHRLCEHHQQLRVKWNARQLADAQQGKQGATTNLPPNQDSSTLGLPGSHPNLGQPSLSLHPTPAAIAREATKDVDKPATGVSNHDEDSDEERLQEQGPKNVPKMPKNVPKRHHVAARKTAANVGSLIRPPGTPPLPPPCGSRRKNPLEDRD